MIKCPDGTTYENYAEYIKSIHWSNRKLEYFRFHDKRCIECGTEKNIHLHHLTYKNIGAENDSELLPLCKQCHDKEHSTNKDFIVGKKPAKLKKRAERTQRVEIDSKLFSQKYNHLSINAKWLYVTLLNLDNKYSPGNKSMFYRSNEELAKDSSMSINTLKRAKKELLKTDLVRHWLTHFVNKETGEKSEKKISAYSILK